MHKLTANDPETHSPDLVAENLARLKALFPELVTEGPDGAAVNVDVLKALVGDKTVADADEKYGLTWHGKRAARQLALTPSTGTLRPCPEDSVDWDSTQNLMIEGDNLEVLKLLQKSYAGKVKLIYIDPPYNTGKDFVYPDDFRDNIKNYLELTGQAEGGRKISSNTEASGRFHTDWLNMMYPRIKIAHHLLADNGALICSIGDEEVGHLMVMMAELFGEENVSANFCIIRSEGGGLARQVVKGHDYLLVYAKQLASFTPLRRPKEIRGDIVNVDGIEYWIEQDWLRREFGKYGTCEYHEIEKWHGIEKKMEIDAGLKSGQYRLISKRSGAQVVGRLRKVEDDASKFYSVQKHLNARASDDLENIELPLGVFDFPKPVSLLTELALGATYFTRNAGEVILDFFAGSGTTGHAVMAQNAADGGNRRYILVQLPEPLDPENKDQKVAADFCDTLGKPRSLAELTKERLRRAAKKIKDENPLFAGDLGFRVFKLDSSNIRAWEPDRNDLDQTLLDHAEHLKAGRTEQDILYELLLKLGLDLCVPIETRAIAGKAVHSIGGGVLLACLAPQITRDAVEPLAQGIVAWHTALAPAGDTTCVFRDSAFADDVAKTNLAAILDQHGLATVRSL
ncbi:MAG: site-specific DNA-methyltransferase [Thermoflexales bacterium]|nr:site-specific DNA-methyltransferase [Thermoflexales bacterium]